MRASRTGSLDDFRIGNRSVEGARLLVVDLSRRVARVVTSTDQQWSLSDERRQRIGKKKAAVAVAHSILVICWHLLDGDCDYDDLGGDYFTRRNTDRQRDRLVNQLHNLGYRVTLDRPA